MASIVVAVALSEGLGAATLELGADPDVRGDDEALVAADAVCDRLNPDNGRLAASVPLDGLRVVVLRDSARDICLPKPQAELGLSTNAASGCWAK